MICIRDEIKDMRHEDLSGGWWFSPTSRTTVFHQPTRPS